MRNLLLVLDDVLAGFGERVGHGEHPDLYVHLVLSGGREAELGCTAGLVTSVIVCRNCEGVVVIEGFGWREVVGLEAEG